MEVLRSVYLSGCLSGYLSVCLLREPEFLLTLEAILNVVGLSSLIGSHGRYCRRRTVVG